MKYFLSVSLSSILALSCSKSEDANGNSSNPNNQEAFHSRSVGASANEILSSAKYTSLRIEVQYMPGYQPDAAALTHFQNTLSGLVRKSSGIMLTSTEIPATPNLSLSVNDIITIEKANRTAYSSETQLAVYVLYTNGGYVQANTLGVAYRNTSVALFGKTIGDNSGGIGQTSRTKLVATVAEHELVHLMGLVNIGSPMQTNHQDPAHGNHCNNNNCLMYYASETTEILGFLLTGNIPPLDANCKADLTANGGL